ncbi:MAG: pilus assembly protein [Hyphomicrobiaceae bacterium]|nr:pilus assembly protein [Hyphomicrobiaceae bacterium]MCC0022701.1 pilus assembly protein [Hyphomicrobiaceae bacterium]
MPTPKQTHIGSLIKRKVAQLFRKDDGATLIEFGLLAIPFFAIIGATLETAFFLLASQVLDGGVDEAARMIRTGRTQGSNYTVTSFRNEVCNHLYGLFDCSQLRIYVQPVASFSSASFNSNVVDPDDASWTSAESFNDGAGSSVILVRVYYKWPTYLNFFNFDLATLPDNTHLIGAARVFQNEPF